MAFCNSMFAPKGKMLKTLLVFGVFGAAVNFPEGYSNSYPNTSINSFRSMINSSYIRRGLENGLSESVFTWVWSLILNIWFIGYLMGTFLTPFITENYGRKMALLVSNAVALIGAVLGFLSVIFQIPEVLFASRLVSALSSGISLGSLILFLQETTATEYRGMTSFFAETTFMLCNVLGIAFGMNALFGRDLLVLTGVAIVPAFMALILTIPLLETPKYLLMKKNDRKAALESLIFYQGDKIENEKILEEMLLEKSKEEKQTPILVSVLHVLKTPHLRTAFVIGCVSLQVVVGIWPIIYLSTDMLSDHFNEDTAQFASLCFILSNFIAGLFGIFTIERFGRRTLFITLGVANTFSLVLYIVFDTLSDQYEFCRWGTVGALVLNGITYGIGLGPIAFFITSELVNQQYRSIVQSMVYAVNTTSNFIFSFATLPIFEHYKSWSFIPLFIIPSIICLIFLFFKMPETKGREIHDIVDEMIRRDSEASEKKHRKKYNISIASDRTTTISEAQKEIV